MDSMDRMFAMYEDRIAVLEAEAERLKCCGNCRNHSCEYMRYEGYSSFCKSDPGLPDVHPSDPCHFTPSKWEPKR
jgi:hypothetical protein